MDKLPEGKQGRHFKKSAYHPCQNNYYTLHKMRECYNGGIGDTMTVGRLSLIIKLACEQCGKKFFVKDRLKDRKFCSQSCNVITNNKRLGGWHAMHKKLRRNNPDKYFKFQRKANRAAVKAIKKKFPKYIIYCRSCGKKIVWGIKKKDPPKHCSISCALKGENNPMFGKIAYPRRFFVKELGHHVRSHWEKNVLLLLKQENIRYKYEPMPFKIKVNGESLTYTPDSIIDNKIALEIKGPLFSLQVKKMRAFRKQYPQYFFIIVCGRRSEYTLKKLCFVDKLVTYEEVVENKNILMEAIKNDHNGRWHR